MKKLTLLVFALGLLMALGQVYAKKGGQGGGGGEDQGDADQGGRLGEFPVHEDSLVPI